MKVKRLLNIITLIAVLMCCICSFAGCGDAKEYKTQHDCANMKYDSYEDLLSDFVDYKQAPITVDDLKGKIKDFCIYSDNDSKYNDDGYIATYLAEVESRDWWVTLMFNADKELTYFEMYVARVDNGKYKGIVPCDSNDSEEVWNQVKNGIMEAGFETDREHSDEKNYSLSDLHCNNGKIDVYVEVSLYSEKWDNKLVVFMTGWENINE